MIAPVVVHCGIGGLLALLSIPLVLRKVPMNRVYGIRTRAAFASEESWYEINAYGGRLFLLYGLALVAFGLLMRDSAPPVTSIWNAPFVAGPLLVVFVIMRLVNAHARQR